MSRGLALLIVLVALIVVANILAGCARQPNDRSMANMPFDKLVKELAKPIGQ